MTVEAERRIELSLQLFLILLFYFYLSECRGLHLFVRLPQSVCQTRQEGLVCSTFHLWVGQQRSSSAAGWEPGSLSQVSDNKTFPGKTSRASRSVGMMNWFIAEMNFVPGVNGLLLIHSPYVSAHCWLMRFTLPILVLATDLTSHSINGILLNTVFTVVMNLLGLLFEF